MTLIILWLKKEIYQQKFVLYATVLLPGVKNGKKYGMRLNIAQKSANRQKNNNYIFIASQYSFVNKRF